MGSYMSEQKKTSKEPACLHCVSFRLLPAHSFPYKCTLWGIETKTGTYPSTTILRTTGEKCPYFKEKKTKPAADKKQSGPSDNNNLDFRV